MQLRRMTGAGARRGEPDLGSRWRPGQSKACPVPRRRSTCGRTCRSTVIIASGALPNITGPSKNATRLPSGETRSDHAARASWTVVPAGNSTVQGRPPPGSRMTASASVPGIQSASTTPVSTSRRAPPAIGMRASVRTPNALCRCSEGRTARPCRPLGRSTGSARLSTGDRAHRRPPAGRGMRRRAAPPSSRCRRSSDHRV